MIAAILRAQLLSMRSFRLASSRRGAVFSLFTALVWYGFWTFLALAAQNFTSNLANKAEIEAALPRGMMLVFLYWQLAPIVSASLGASLDLRKLLVYPIPPAKLFLVELLLRLTTCLEMVLILGGAAIGLFRNPVFGSWAAAPRLLVPVLVFIVFNLLLAAGLRSLLERLLARKHIREVVVLVLVLVTALPRLALAGSVRLEALERLSAAGKSLLWPWTAAARLELGQDWLAGAVVLGAWTLLACGFGWWQFGNSLRYDLQAAQATDLRKFGGREESWIQSACRIPSILLPDPVAAIVEKELRSLSRTPRFRMVFIMGFSFGLLVWLPVVVGSRGGGRSVIADNFLILVSVYALMLLGQVSYWNAFGFDRSAAQVYFSMPVPLAKTLGAKNLAAAFFILLEVAAVTLACLLLRMRISAAKVLEAFLVTPAASLYLLALGNLSSVHCPRAMNPERVSQGGAAKGFQALWFFFFHPLALLPVFLAYLARFAFHSEIVFYLVLAFAALLGVIVYWIAMDSAVEAAGRRREIILGELSRSEGPVVSE